MSLDNLGNGADKKKTGPARLDLGSSFGKRAFALGRRQLFAGALAAGGAYGAGKLAEKYGTESIVGVDDAERQKERELLQKQIKEYEDARAKGTKDWASKWWENFKKGYKEHGLNLPKGWAAYSEEGLRGRLATLEMLSMAYKPLSYVFFYTAAAPSLVIIHYSASRYLAHAGEIDRLKRTEDFANETRRQLEEIQAASAAQLEVLHKLSQQDEKVAPPSKEEFDGMLATIADLTEKMHALEMQLGPTPGPNVRERLGDEA